MNVLTKLVSASLLLVLSQTSFAFTECTRTVDSIWNDLDVQANVIVTFTDGSAIDMKPAGITSEQMHRFFTMAVTAKTLGRDLTVRYAQDGMLCTEVSVREDILGIWLL